MDSSKEKITINLMLGRQRQTITIPRDQEETYRRAANEINGVLAAYERKYAALGYDRIIAITMLDFSVKAERLQQRCDTAPYTETLERLSGEITALLDGADGGLSGGDNGMTNLTTNNK